MHTHLPHLLWINHWDRYWKNHTALEWMLQWFRGMKYRRRGEKAAGQRRGTILSCRSDSSWWGAHSCDFPTTKVHPAVELTVLSRGKACTLAIASLLCWLMAKACPLKQKPWRGQPSALTDHSVKNSVIWNRVSVLACACVYCTVGEAHIYNSEHIYGEWACVCVCVFLFCREKGSNFHLRKSLVFVFLNDGYVLCADSVYVSVTLTQAFS